MSDGTPPRAGKTMWRALSVAFAAGALASCINGPAVLTQHLEAHRLASDLHVQFTRAADAANRAVMADTDEASSAAAADAREAGSQVQHDLEELQSVLKSLGYADEIRALEAFASHYVEYRKLDDDVLPLAVENTNLKAQRLSFGEGQEAAQAFRKAMDDAAKAGGSAAKAGCCAEAVAANAAAAVLEIQVIQARHIAESEDAAMSRMEGEMATLEASARRGIQDMKRQVPAADKPLAAAAAALDRFMASNTQIVSLSRRNSNVRSLALALGRMRTVTAECDDLLRMLEDTLDSHQFRATR